MRKFSLWTALILFLAALLLQTGLGVAGGQSPPVSGGLQPQAAGYSGACVTNKIKFTTEYATVSSAGKDWEVMPGTSVNFTVGGTGYSCLKVEFAAVIKHTGVSYIWVSLEGMRGLPNYVYHDPEEMWHTVAFNWAFANVPPGPHQIKIIWYNVNGRSWVTTRSVFVHYYQ